MSRQAIALNRFGLGARLEDRPPEDPEGWLRAQLDRYDVRPSAIAAVAGRGEVAGELASYVAELRDGRRASRNRSRPSRDRSDRARRREQRADDAMMPDEPAMADGEPEERNAPPEPLQELRRANRDYFREMVGARTNAALTTPTPFIERLVHFWANHFAVSADKVTVIGVAGLLEFDAIRPHVLGRFEDMLLAAETHPAMLFYLDQVQSIGPNSRAGGGGGRQRGLNENLAREILELHTLGVDGDYSQADVTEFARALTGWSVNGLVRQRRVARHLDADGEPGTFAFAAPLHEPGARQIMGRSYAEGGAEQGRAILGDLARHPSTARHLATKLARHFAGDSPPPALVDRLASAYRESDGDLPTVYRALIASPEAWVDEPVKFKSPWEWYVSALRALGTEEIRDRSAYSTLIQLGQPVWRPGSPAGYDDLAAHWAGPDALVRRVELAGQLALAAADRIDPRQLAPRLFPGQLSDSTAQSIARAEGESQGLALLLVSPEFQRR